MGYTPPKKLYDLDFTGTEHEGLEITVRDMSTDELISMPNETTHEALVTSFAGQLESWNLDGPDGTPLAPTLENVRKQDRSLNQLIVNKWLDALNGVPSGPLPQPSPGGEPSPAVTIPMEPLT